jgi:hypothetical protein
MRGERDLFSQASCTLIILSGASQIYEKNTARVKQTSRKNSFLFNSLLFEEYKGNTKRQPMDYNSIICLLVASKPILTIQTIALRRRRWRRDIAGRL